MAFVLSHVQAGRNVQGELEMLAGGSGATAAGYHQAVGWGGDAPVTPLFVASFSLLMTNRSVPVSAALAESRFPDKSNNPACLESRDYFLKCKRGTFALTVVAKVHLPFPLSRAAGSFPHARLAPVPSRWLAGALPPSEEILLS